jgi:hypothetical protein
MKFVFKGLIFLFTSFSINLNAQEIIGDWIKTRVMYLNDAELPDENGLKYQYLRYSFENGRNFLMSSAFDDPGTILEFEIDNNFLQIKNSFGFITNAFLIEKLTDKDLVLVQKGQTGFSENSCIKFYFEREKTYQAKLLLKPSDILLINNTDTVYKATEKIHAKFVSNKSFYEFCSENMPEIKTVMTANNIFLSTFIVRKTGVIDSIQILENINKRFEKQFRKTLIKSQNFWHPGILNDRKVDVQMKMTFKFISSDNFLPMYDYSQKGKNAMKDSDHMRALYYFDLAIEKNPDDYEILYLKAICELNLGNKEAACYDLEKVRSSGKMQITDVINKNCK